MFLDGNEKHALNVQTYFADRQPNPPLPNKAYKDQILAGARYWGLPSDYIVELEVIEG